MCRYIDTSGNPAFYFYFKHINISNQILEWKKDFISVKLYFYLHYNWKVTQKVTVLPRSDQLIFFKMVIAYKDKENKKTDGRGETAEPDDHRSGQWCVV